MHKIYSILQRTLHFLFRTNSSQLSWAKFPGITLLILALFSQTLFSQDPDPILGKKLFNANCAACHKVNKKAVGPALKGVSAKYEKEWLYTWIKNSSAMIKSGDARAIAIWEEYNKSAMIKLYLLDMEEHFC